jgi:hypothetical protein
MKRSTSAVLTIASLAGMASIANAVPFGPNNLPTQVGGLGLGEVAQGGGACGGSIGQAAQTFGSSIGPNIVSQISPNSFAAVPEGSHLLLLGAGLFALALWRRFSSHVSD